jgi:EAL domain-containing protein (putative c-di-GMP-specific phosphodiesterase class I)
VDSVECLVRWQHPERGLLYPDAFIGLAEQHGLMRGLTLAVLEQALCQQAAWAERGLHLKVAVNISPANLLDSRFHADVAAQVARWALGADRLELEITEDTVMLDPQRALDTLACLSELGITFALDDFGTGYSSLAQLKRLPVSALKIDRSFVMDMTTSREDATIVRSIVELAHNLGLHVVAEGVETSEHWDALARLGCDSAQGYFLTRPVPADGLEQWMRDRAARALLGSGQPAAPAQAQPRAHQ